jgi:hypothetical protein
MRRILLGLVLGVVAAGSLGCQWAPADTPAPQAGARRLADIALAADSMLIAGTVPSGRTLGAMLAAFDLHEQDRHALLDAVQRVFDVRRLRVGQPFRLDRLFDGRVRSFESRSTGIVACSCRPTPQPGTPPQSSPSRRRSPSTPSKGRSRGARRR